MKSHFILLSALRRWIRLVKLVWTLLARASNLKSGPKTSQKSCKNQNQSDLCGLTLEISLYFILLILWSCTSLPIQAQFDQHPKGLVPHRRPKFAHEPEHLGNGPPPSVGPGVLGPNTLEIHVNPRKNCSAP